jgi:hypothetical protein
MGPNVSYRMVGVQLCTTEILVYNHAWVWVQDQFIMLNISMPHVSFKFQIDVESSSLHVPRQPQLNNFITSTRTLEQTGLAMYFHDDL